jgi:hypothetical protein
LTRGVRLNINCLDVPLLAVFKLGPTAEIHAGAYGSYLLRANIEYHGNLSNGVDEFDREASSPPEPTPGAASNIDVIQLQFVV